MIYQQYLVNKDIDIPGVPEVLATLSRNYRMAIVTTAKWADFELIHAERQITPFMEFVLANGDYPRAKPAPDPYETARQRFGATTEECLVIEDSERGLRSAVAAGIRCAVVYNEFTSHQDFSQAEWHLGSLTELVGLLEIEASLGV